MHRLLVTYFYKRIGKFDVNDGLDIECIDDEFVNLLLKRWMILVIKVSHLSSNFSDNRSLNDSTLQVCF